MNRLEIVREDMTRQIAQVLQDFARLVDAEVIVPRATAELSYTFNPHFKQTTDLLVAYIMDKKFCTKVLNADSY